MAAYSYEAIDGSGRTKRGTIEAGNVSSARHALRAQNLLPVKVTSTRPPAIDGPTDARASASFLSRFRPGQRVTGRNLATATRQLSTLIGSQVRVEEALRLVSRQSETPAIGAVLADARQRVLEGSSLANGLATHPTAFPEYYVASIRAGEQAGRLPEVLAYLADFVEARHRANRTLLMALLYPGLLATISALMMTAMMVYVVPDIVRVFVSRGADLPLLTRLLIAVSTLVNDYGLIILLLLVVTGFLLRREMKRPERRLALDRFLVTRRPFARFVRQFNAARFSATLATLVQSAVPLLDALNAAAAVVPNRYVRTSMEGVANKVREGDSVSHAMREADILPPMLVAIVASGEASGKLGIALHKASGELDREVEEQLQVIVSLVEPIVLLLMGGMVLLMVMAILMPIIGLNDLAI
ncbi:type II secretion system F family protein [Tsuneonella sp. HG222]